MSFLFSYPPNVGVSGVFGQAPVRQVETMLEAGTHVSWVVGALRQSDGFEPLPRFANLAAALAGAKPDLLLMFDNPLEICSKALEALEAGLGGIVIITEHVPVHDMIVLRRAARQKKAVVVGPNSTGILIPGKVKAGYFSEDVCIPGRVGVVAKSGSLAYAVLCEMRSVGVGVSAVVSTGGDIVKGATFEDILPCFEKDTGTDAIVLLGEIGGTDEEHAAELISSAVTKPVVAFVSGKSIKPGASVGHAGAIVRNGMGAYANKVAKLRAAGVMVADQLGDIVPKLLDALQAGGGHLEVRGKRQSIKEENVHD